MSFPAKSGKQADLTIDDRAVARVITKLEQHRKRRLFTVDGKTIESAEVNDLLHELTGEHITAKDFRTWHGTLAAFTYLGSRGDAERPRASVDRRVDAAAEVLGNTRAVARAHYIHPHVLTRSPTAPSPTPGASARRQRSGWTGPSATCSRSSRSPSNPTSTPPRSAWTDTDCRLRIRPVWT